MDNRIKKTKILVCFFVGIFVGLVLCLGAGFVLYTHDCLYFSINNKKDSNAGVQTDLDTSEDGLDNLYFNSTKVINSNADSYNLMLFTYSNGIHISLDTTQMIATVSVNRKLVNQTYTLGWDTSTGFYGYEPHEIFFDQKVVDIFFGGIGQDGYFDTILFLMEDGSVQYIPVITAISTNLDNLGSYGVLPSVSGIVKFYAADANRQVGSGMTILAQDKDGKIYDLSSILQKTGNY